MKASSKLFSIGLLIAFMLTIGCSNSNVSSSESLIERSSAVQTETIEAETEATTEDNSMLYDYYEKLNKEWNEVGNTKLTRLLENHIDYGCITYKNNLIGHNYETHQIWVANADGMGKIVYNTNIFLRDNYMAMFCSGFIYITGNTEDSGYLIEKIDIDGNTIGKTTTGEIVSKLGLSDCTSYSDTFAEATPSGHMLVHISTGASYRYVIISPDFSEYKLLNDFPKFSNGHGEFEERSIRADTVYKNRIYMFDKQKLSNQYLDCDSLEWVPITIPDELMVDEASSIIGRYILSKGIIYDMETNSIIAHNSTNRYVGGDSSLYIKNGQAIFIRNPSNGQYGEELRIYDNINENAIPINTEKYAVVDKYGVFIHSFEKGESEEIAAIRFE